MNLKTLRWGLLSTARINQALIPPLRALKRHQLLAVASRSDEAARDYARRWNIPRAYGSYAALLADPEIDIIYNPLPNGLHAEWTIKATQAGKHVLCEKPLALSVEEVDAMAVAARQAGVVVAEAFMYRHHPQTLKVKEIVDAGLIGTLRYVKGQFSFNLDRSNDVRWEAAQGGGSIWDIGCYPISFARYVIGREPEQVFGWQATSASKVDEVFVGQMRFPGDVFAQFDCSFRAPFRAYFEVVGSQASLQIPAPFKPGKREKIFLVRGEKMETIKIRGQELYAGEVEDMADAIFLGKPPRISLADSRANVATIVALLHSAGKGQPVSL
jgi:predicted dehydrogenase